MAPIGERMAGVEARLGGIETKAAEIGLDVKALLAWRDEERGARAQRGLSLRLMSVALAGLTVAINVVFRAFG